MPSHLWILQLAIVATLILSRRAAGTGSTLSTLHSIVEQLSSSHARVDALLERTAAGITRGAKKSVADVNAERDKTLEKIRSSYASTAVTDPDISDVVVRAAREASAFGGIKRTIVEETVAQMRVGLSQALTEVDRLVSTVGADAHTQAVLANARQRIQRHFARTVEAVRLNSETIIAATVRDVCELGATALRLNDRVRTTAAAQRADVQRQLQRAVEAALKGILATFDKYDARILHEVAVFVRYVRWSERPLQAVGDYVSDVRTGIVETKL